METSGIGRQWARDGHESGAGYPTSPEVATSTGAYQRFRSPATGRRTQYTWTRATGRVQRSVVS